MLAPVGRAGRSAAVLEARERSVCFSVEADLVAGAALVPVGVLSLREVKKPDELPFAALPLLFALHQFV